VHSILHVFHVFWSVQKIDYILAAPMSSSEPFSDLPLSFVLAVIGGDDEPYETQVDDDLVETDGEFDAG
jgi:hypothetical protein